MSKHEWFVGDCLSSLESSTNYLFSLHCVQEQATYIEHVTADGETFQQVIATTDEMGHVSGLQTIVCEATPLSQFNG